MRVLWLTYDLPYPLTAGGKIRAYHLIKGLAKNHQITLFAYIRSSDQLKDANGLKKYCQKVETFKRTPVWSLNHLLGASFSSLPGAAALYEHQKLKNQLTKELKNRLYDLVHFESFYPALYLPLVKSLGVKTLMGNENVEYKIYQRFIKNLPFYLLPVKLPLAFDVWRMRSFERGLWKKADANIAVSEGDAKEIETATGRPCSVIPNGVEITSCRPPVTSSQPPKILFIGNLKYIQNDQAMRWFLAEIWPRIKKDFPTVRLELVSGYKPAWLERYLDQIIFTEDAKTPARDFLREASVFIVPVHTAGGTRIKILEAMGAGIPVVSTTVGIEGIKAAPGIHALLADDPVSFAQKTAQLLKNGDQRRQIGARGQLLVKSKYTWEQSVAALNKVYQKFVRCG